ncbi:MAG: aminopeptidase P family N-terminal domain-containing protein, partial [Actinomycetota bacterium]|nr:aminopeptidase P family N-terminal domain-containing protein [Actinomycetota bacterium]
MTVRRERALEIARRLGADGVLAAEPSSVTWLTGFEADIGLGPSPFALPPLAVVTPDGPPILVVSETMRSQLHETVR